MNPKRRGARSSAVVLPDVADHSRANLVARLQSAKAHHRCAPHDARLLLATGEPCPRCHVVVPRPASSLL